MVAMFTGLRVGETAAMVWESVDWKRGTHLVSKSLASELRIDDTAKTQGSEVDVLLPPIVVEALKRHQIRQRFLNRSERATKTKGWSCTRYGNPHAHHIFRDRWHKDILGTAELRHVSFHTLRQSFGSLLLHVSGGNLKEVQAALRHADIVLTANTYTVTSDERLSEDLDKMQAWLAS